MNVYYYKGQIIASQGLQKENRKSVFPLLYDVQELIYVPFKVELNSTQKKVNSLIKKKAYIGHKKNNKEQKFCLYVNEDKSWNCEQLSCFKNKTDFNTENITFSGSIWLHNDQEDENKILQEYISTMKFQAANFLNIKISQYQNYLNIIHRDM